jgi:serpin B
MLLQTITAALAAAATNHAFAGRGDDGANPAAPQLEPGALTPFALDAFAQLATNPSRNVFFSPLSIFEALWLLERGARRDTEQEIAGAMAVSGDQLQAISARITQIVRGKNLPYTISLANAAWVDRTCLLRKDYADGIRSQFAATVDNCDFVSAAEKERQRINIWVAQQTRDRIKDLMPAGSIDPLTRLVLTNAIYFNAEWDSAFDRSQTRPGIFSLDSERRSVPATFMNQTFHGLGYFEDTTVQAIDMPYKGGAASMLVILPRRNTLAEIMDEFTPARIREITGRLRGGFVEVKFPKFKLETSVDLAPALKNLGIHRAFDAKSADFSGISDEARAQQLHVTQAVHKAYLDINEERTEAAAATGFGAAGGGRGTREDPFVFKADHPFIFAIRDRATQEILFLGRLANAA